MMQRFAGIFAIAGVALTMLAQSPQPVPRPLQGFTIAGIALNSITHQPVSGADVVIAPVSARAEIRGVTTGLDGRFTFSGLARGKYSLEGSGKGYHEQGLDQHDFYATAVAVGPELDSEHIVFRLQPDASIEGRIIDEENEPVENASVQLYVKNTEEGEEKATPRGQANTDDRGYYRIGHLAPGTYYLAVAARPWYAQSYARSQYPAGADPDTIGRLQQEISELDKAYPLTFYPNVVDSAAAGAITLRAGEHFSADMTLQAVKAVHLKVHGISKTSGEDSSGLQVNVRQRVFDRIDSASQGVAMMSIADGGTVEVMGLAPGHYLIEVRIPSPRGTKTWSSGWYQELDLAADADLTAATSQAFADVSGVIHFEGAPPPKNPVFVRLNDYYTGETLRAPLRPEGEFTFRNDHIIPSRYEMVLENSQGFALQKMAATGATVSGRTLDITTGGAVRVAGIASHGIGEVNGTALREGKPVAGAMIVLVPKDPANNLALFRRDQSDSDGTFTLPNIVPGPYTLLAIANGWDLEWASPVVLQPYLKAGEAVQVPGEGKLQVKVPVQ